jgi:hypothetical protein
MATLNNQRVSWNFQIILWFLWLFDFKEFNAHILSISQIDWPKSETWSSTIHQGKSLDWTVSHRGLFPMTNLGVVLDPTQPPSGSNSSRSVNISSANQKERENPVALAINIEKMNIIYIYICTYIYMSNMFILSLVSFAYINICVCVYIYIHLYTPLIKKCDAVILSDAIPV